MSISEDELLVHLQPYLGREIGPFHSWDAVNEPMIRHWCEAMGIGNSLPGMAPPAMLLVWTMNGLRGEPAPGSTDEMAYRVLEAIRAAGYPAIVVVNSEQTYSRYLIPGDRLYRSSQIESVSARKNTALGTGYFVSEKINLFDQHDNWVGSARMRMFLYRAQSAAATSDPEAPSRLDKAIAAPGSTNTAENALPSLSIPITVTGIVAGALATRDFQNIHHDVDAARALGSPHIFMNFLTTHGLVERFVTGLYGPKIRVISVELKLGVPNYPGDTLKFIGNVASQSKDVERTLAIESINALGRHVTGTVRLIGA